MSAFGRQEWPGPYAQAHIFHALRRAEEARPRPIAESAKGFLCAHDEHFQHFGGAEGLIDCCDAAAVLKWALLSLEALLVIARRGAP